jgi:hypothetical protein
MFKEKYGKVVCHDRSFRLATKTRAWKSAGQECNLGVTFTPPKVRENVRE